MKTKSLLAPNDSYEKAQRVIVGHVLNFPSTADEIFELLGEADVEAFADPVTRQIVQAMRTLHGRGTQVSITSVVAEARRAGHNSGISTECVTCMDSADSEYQAQELGSTHEDYVTAFREGYRLCKLRTDIHKAPDYQSAMRAVEEVSAWEATRMANDEGGYGEVAEQIYRLRQKDGPQDRRKDFEIASEVTQKILSHLSEKGAFYTDGHQSYFFFETQKQLIEVHGEDGGFRLLLHRYGINPTETIYRWIVEALRNEALGRGTPTDIHRLSYYNPERFILYVHNHQSQIYRITPDRIDLVDNGADGVLFSQIGERRPSSASLSHRGARA